MHENRVDTMQAMAASGIVMAAECGPGKVLAGLNKRIVADMASFALTGAESIGAALSQLGIEGE